MQVTRSHLVAILLALGALTSLYSPASSAATQCPQNPIQCTQAEAYGDAERQAKERAAVVCVAPTYNGMLSFRVNGPTGSVDSGSYGADFTCRLPNGTSAGPNSSGIAFAFYKNVCTTRPDVLQTNQPNGALQCVGGCEHRFFVEPVNPNGVVFSRGVSSGKACRPDNYTCPQGFRPGAQPGDFMVSRNCIPIVPDKCPAGQTLVNGVCKRPEQCPDGMVQNASGACEPKKTECAAGQVKGPDGSCVDDGKCPAGQARGKDGSCKKDGDGDGKPDAGEDDGKFSGGETCEEPPQCSGDNIMCGQARILWRIDCNTRKNRNVSGGGCNAEPICTGDKCDALEYSQLLQQWRAACALERLEAKTTGAGAGTGQPDWTKVTGDGTGGAGAEPTGMTRVVGQSIEGKLDGSGFFGGNGNCPRLGTIDAGKFGSFDLDEMSWFCDLLTMVRWILRLLGAFIALGILMGWRIG